MPVRHHVEQRKGGEREQEEKAEKTEGALDKDEG
jgi:hypothetical protein